MKARVKWIEGVAMLGESGSGHGLIMDGPPDLGGRNLGVRPMEMLLLGMGGRTQFERAESDPKVFTRIHAHFIITGRDLSRRHVERAIQLSAEKYCSASIMLGASAEVTHDFEIRDV